LIYLIIAFHKLSNGSVASFGKRAILLSEEAPICLSLSVEGLTTPLGVAAQDREFNKKVIPAPHR
jgi:hypothetical protein